jgi:hypothetical protein
MAVRLQTAKGKIKKYDTVDHISGDYGPDKWVTKCGREWKHAPKQHEECDHLDCAMYLAKRYRDDAQMVFIILIAFAAGNMILWEQEPLGFALMISGVIALGAFWILISGLKAGNRFKELIEYKNERTINGITAWKNS